MEINDMSTEDINETSKLLKQVPALVTEVTEVVRGIKRLFGDEGFNTEKGLSFLDLKNSNLLDYVTNLTYIILKKLSGKTIQSDPAIKRLVHLRVIMEKMRPIEERMKYQINKLLSNVSSEKADPLKFRANPENLDMQDDGGHEDEDNDTTEAEKKDKVYVPPKISATYYNEDFEEQKKKLLDQARKKALHSSLIYELRQEYDTAPEEIREMNDPYTQRITKELKERQEFEEEYMTRLPMTKKLKHEMRRLTTVTNFNPKFENISALEMTPDSIHPKKKSKSSGKKGKSKYRGKKKGSKRKH